MNKCKHCKKEFDISDRPKGWMANHSRWCDLNPKRSAYNKDLIKARGAKKNFNNGYTYGAVCSEETRKKISLASTGRLHTEEAKKLMSEKALASPHRRLRKGMVEYKGVMLDSSWELALAKRLDELEIKWVRPEPIRWIDNDGIGHNYFGDFYLVEHDLYLDPKNPQAIKVQKEKLDCLLTQHKNIVIIDSLEKCEQYRV